MLTDLQIKSEFIDGLRKTTKPVMDVVEMVLTAIVNNEITRKLNDHGIQSIGLIGSDAQLLKARPKDFNKLGNVDEVTDVIVEFLYNLLETGVVPVITPI